MIHQFHDMTYIAQQGRIVVLRALRLATDCGPSYKYMQFLLFFTNVTFFLRYVVYV